MVLEDKVSHLAYLYGVELQTSVENKIYALQALGVLPLTFDVNDKNSVFHNSMIVDSIVKERLDTEYSKPIDKVSVIRKNRKDFIIVSLPDGVDNLNWKLTEENDASYSGIVKRQDLEPIFDDNNNLCERTVDGVSFKKFKFHCPFEISIGYHVIDLDYVNNNGEVVKASTNLISAPEKCFDRLGIAEGNKTWGVPVQLYEQVSESNLGIGNYSDLAHIGYITGKKGAGILGVSPQHAMREDEPEKASPYSPSSQDHYNYLHLDVTAVKEFKNNPDIQEFYHGQEFQEKVIKNRRKGFVDYTTTKDLVDEVLTKCFAKFIENKRTEGYKKFCVYCDDMGESFEAFATYNALTNEMLKRKPRPLSWHDWPEEYKNFNSDTVQKFKTENREAINYYKYVQWLAKQQLKEVNNVCAKSGMKVGLYTDMAVGSSPKGFDAWYCKDIFVKASAGAPPDILSQNGQNWNAVGFNPESLRNEGYKPYVRRLEAAMKYAGCTRIDHVLQLQRLYFIPDGKEPKNGAYIYYNSDEMMALVALESHRNKCMVIGEDLGALPEGFREKLEDFNIMSYRVLPFEREWGFQNGGGSNAVRHPEEYPQYSVCATSTHDTPPLASQWNVRHVYQQKMLDVLTEEQVNTEFEKYATQREALNYALTEKGSWERVGGKPVENPRADATKLPEKFIEAVADYMSKSKSAIMLMPFSDIFGISEMGNIPGVTEIDMSTSSVLLEVERDKAYANWRKKMHIPVEAIEKVPLFNYVAEILNEERKDGNDGRGAYFKFKRIGEDVSGSIDYDRYIKMYNILKNKEDFEYSNLIEARYNSKRGDYYTKKVKNMQINYCKIAAQNKVR